MNIEPQAQANPSLDDIWRLFQETDRQMKQTDLKMKETDRQMKAMIKENHRLAKETNQKIGQLGNRLGDFVEAMVKPAVVALFQQRGIIVHKVTRDIEANDPDLGLATQIDLLAINADVCIPIEVKSKLSHDDVNEHLQRMDKFKPLFPEYKDRQVFGAVAAIVIPDNVAKYAYRKGFYVIAQKGDNAVILNNQQFKPKAW